MEVAGRWERWDWQRAAERSAVLARRALWLAAAGILSIASVSAEVAFDLHHGARRLRHDWSPAVNGAAANVVFVVGGMATVTAIVVHRTWDRWWPVIRRNGAIAGRWLRHASAVTARAGW